MQTFSRIVRQLLAWEVEAELAADKLEAQFKLLLQRAFSGQLTAQWRQAHMTELLAEMQEQAKALNLPMPEGIHA